MSSVVTRSLVAGVVSGPLVVVDVKVCGISAVVEFLTISVEVKVLGMSVLEVSGTAVVCKDVLLVNGGKVEKVVLEVLGVVLCTVEELVY